MRTLPSRTELISAAGPLAIKMAKLAIQTGSRLDLEAGLDLEAQCYATLFPTQDRLEGLKACVTPSTRAANRSKICREAEACLPWGVVKCRDISKR